MSEELPATQDAHELVPDAAAKVPPMQRAQVAAEVAPVIPRDVPALQLVQKPEPALLA
jgi:hypothetical protein